MDEHERRQSTGRRVDNSAVGRRRLLAATGGGAMGVTVAGCLDAVPLSLSDTDEGPVRIGVLAPRPDRDLIGMSTAHGAELGAAELNEGGGLSGIPDESGFESNTSFDIESVLEFEEDPPDGFEDVELDMDGLLEGGILGRDIEVLVRDTKGSPAETRRQYQQLVVEEDVDLTMGIFWTEVLEHVIEDIANHETLHLTVGSASSVPNDLIYEEDYDRYKYHFRLGPFNDSLLVRNQMDFMADMQDELGWSDVAVLTEGYDWAEALGPAFTQFLPTIGLEVVHQDHYPPEDSDFVSRYETAIEEGADAILAGMSHTGDQAILQWAEMGRPIDFGGIHIPAQRPDYHGLQVVGDAPEYSIGQTIATDTMASDIPAIDGLLNAYTNRYPGEIPMFTGYSSYTAMMLYATVAEAAGTVDPEVLVPALEAVHFDSPTGPIEFYERDRPHVHDPKYGEDFIQGVFFQWQNGRQQVIWPERFATSEYIPPS